MDEWNQQHNSLLGVGSGGGAPMLGGGASFGGGAPFGTGLTRGIAPQPVLGPALRAFQNKHMPAPHGVGFGSMPLAGGGGGGYSGGGGGGFIPPTVGGTPSFEGMGHQLPALAKDHLSGETIAPIAQGAGQYHGLSSFDAQFNDPEHPRPQMTSWGEGWGEASKAQAPLKLSPEELARRAYGGPVPHGQPFIAGDTQKDGKPNPELILPTPEGVHVVPLKSLPMHGEGTVRANDPAKQAPGNATGQMMHRGLKPPVSGMAGFHQLNPHTPCAAVQEMTKLMTHPELRTPITLPTLPKYAYGTVRPEGDRLEAFDDSGKLVGWSTGVTLPPAPSAPVLTAPGTDATQLANLARQQLQAGNIDAQTFNTGMEMLRAGHDDPFTVKQVRAGFSDTWQQSQKAQAEAREKAMNPQGIDVGFTPRPALHGFADADALRANPTGASREDRQFARMERDVMREARGNPYIAQRLLAGRAAAANAQAQMDWEREKEGNKITHQDRETQRKANAAAGYADTGAGVGQPMSKTVAAQRLEAENANRELTGKRADEQLRIEQEGLTLRQAADQRAAEAEQRRINPTARVVSVEGTNLGRAFSSNGQELHGMPTYQQTNPGVPGMRTPSVNVPWMGQIPSMSFPGSPAQYQQMPDPKAAAAEAKVQATTAKDHFAQAEVFRKALAEAEAEDSKHPMDATTKARYKALHEKYLSELEKAAGIEPPPAPQTHTSSGSVLSRVQAARAAMKDSAQASSTQSSMLGD